MWKILGKLSSKIKLFASFAIIFSILQPFLTMTIPTITKQLITSVSGEKINNIYFIKPDWIIIKNLSQNGFLWATVGLSFGIATLLLLISYFSGLLSVKTKVYGVYEIRKILFDHVIHLEKKNIDKITAGTLITRFGNDIDKIDFGFFVITRKFWLSPFFVIWGLIFAFSTNIYLSIAIAITIPFLIIFALIAIFKLFPIYRKENRMLEKLNETIKEDINAISLIKSYNLENKLYERFHKSAIDVTNINLKAAKSYSILWPFIDFIVLFGNIILFIVVGIIISKNNYNSDVSLLVGEIYQFTSYMSMISIGVYTTLLTLNEFFRANISANRVLEILKIKNELKIIKSNKFITNGKIEFKNVNFRYSENKVLENINLVINPGEKVGIIGKTGSGKSTLIKLLTREYKLENDNGFIKIDDNNIYEIDTNNFFNNISIVFQKPIIISGSIRKNISFSSKNENYDIEKAAELSCADFIEDLENKYDYDLTQRGKNLSGGQKQRIAIAQAILKNPKILILDDATSALDNKTDNTVRKNIENLNKNRTLIIISQRLKSIINCDKIIVMDKGKIIDIGNHKDLLLKNEYYKEIYNIQSSEVENG
ncbi:ABC-type multidrug/protein/lipid transport system ATPase component [Mycoplasmopsis maculosa]|uniref:ABC-type multidrug/protein/lipid transport system ATPase component n=1 Tax=Mycoplasmopsis maculosa TaxID=114885 RepID=A0A449B3I5_9BACT|nr:ABC transporter ATP-binding protein [Mycoplasmopsis maculosa]VEU75164.1 ABC-type multidrug/protein/lipid transport system ATPase component [Mycoplasmopsis maculosa]